VTGSRVFTDKRRQAVRRQWAENRYVWLATGVLFGLVLAFYWPHEQAQADTVDRANKIVMVTVNTQPGSADAVFVLDIVTGRLVGAAYNTQTGGFNQSYFANLAADFQVRENAEYAIVPGNVSLPQRGGPPPANGGLYVAELNSGVVIMYGFPFITAPGSQPTLPLQKIAAFPFRQVQ
jgi:hypothetical protein